MTEALRFFVDMFKSILQTLENCTFEMYGLQVNFAGIVFAFIVIGIVVSVMWKGAKG